MVFGVVTSDGGHYVSIHLLTCPKTQYRSLHEVPRGGSAVLDQEGGCWKTLHLATELYTMSDKQENPILVVKRFLQPHQP